MGWISMHREKGTTNEEFFLREWSHKATFHACGTVNNVFYAAVETEDSPGEVRGFVALMQWNPNDYHNFTYKDMGESCGPGACAAPEAVLNALTPTDNEYALAWRAACRTHHDRRKALRGLQDGDTVTLRHALTFTDGSKADTFTIRKDRMNGRARVVLTMNGSRCRIPNWRDHVASVNRGGEVTNLITT